MTGPLPRLLFLLHLLVLSPASILSLTEEGLHLLAFKSTLDFSASALANWTPADPTPCSWSGVTCSSSDSVTSLDLPGLGLSGPFHPSLCLLPNLTRLSLADNNINSTLPSSSLLPCTSLTHLDLSDNLLVGTLPSALSSLPSLLHLDLSSNNFSGPIPPSYALFPKLQNLSLENNLLSRTIPPFLANISTLRNLSLAYNPFAPGPLPSELGNLASLEYLWLTKCNLVSSIPSSLGNLSNLQNLDLSRNNLVGSIPGSLAKLTNAYQIELFQNMLTGEIPLGLGNLVKLRSFDASMNRLEGTIPPELFALPSLEDLSFYSNRLVGGLPASVSKAVKLSMLRVFDNKLSGPIPIDLGEKNPLRFVDLSQNLFSGEIPRGICDMGFLEQLMLIENGLSGTIPEGLGQCRSLQRLRLSTNILTGEVPAGVWALPRVYFIDLAENSLTGTISTSISKGTNISKLTISDNLFNGTIPQELGSLSNLHTFLAGNNRLAGQLPEGLGKLAELEKLDLHGNSLSGPLLTGIKSWSRLTELNLANNDFTGAIPPELGNLPSLNYLDLSNNLLSGAIPTQLQSLNLAKLNLSNNQLSGRLPPLYAKAFKDSFLGNPGLCSSDSDASCMSASSSAAKKHMSIWIFVAAGMVLVVGLAGFYWRHRVYKKAKKELEKSKWTLKSFHSLDIKEYEVFDRLDEANVIGSGASGKVYKVALSNGETVAVKKLWGSSSKKEGYEDEKWNQGSRHDTFDTEITTLGRIRHKNIVRLWCCCSYEGCKMLVYEYMHNGSLGDKLHNSKTSGLLDWPTRYKIALGAAEGLAYLHHDCSPPVVHRDIKSNNILLDEEYEARLADFGVAKAIRAVEDDPESTSVVAGSYGYIAPEYAYTLRVNEKSDIYSFGVVILELVTGKSPGSPEMGETDFVKWVCTTLEKKGEDHVVDQKLDSCHLGEISMVLDIGIQCTNSIPLNRPSMRKVVKMLLGVRGDSRKKTEKKGGGTLSPYYHQDH